MSIKPSRLGFRHPANTIIPALLLTVTSLIWMRQHIPKYTPIIVTDFSPVIQTHCVGRYLIDLPESMGNAKVSNVILYFGLGKNFKQVEIDMPENNSVTPAVFEQFVNSRRMELKTTIQSTADVPLLLHEKLFSNLEKSNGILFRRLSGSSTIISELHLLIQDKYVILKSESYPPETSYQEERNDRFKLVDPNAAEKRISDVASALIRIKQNDNTRAGFCMNDVLIDNSIVHYDEEKATFHFNPPEFKGLALFDLTIDMMGKYGYESETLHDRMANRTMLANMLGGLKGEIRIRNIRRTDRTIEAVSFQEWADEVYFLKEKSTQYAFALQNERPKKGFETFNRPAIIVNLESGGTRYENTLSPYSLHQLEPAWDQWLGSLRLSPGNRHALQ